MQIHFLFVLALPGVFGVRVTTHQRGNTDFGSASGIDIERIRSYQQQEQIASPLSVTYSDPRVRDAQSQLRSRLLQIEMIVDKAEGEIKSEKWVGFVTDLVARGAQSAGKFGPNGNLLTGITAGFTLLLAALQSLMIIDSMFLMRSTLRNSCSARFTVASNEFIHDLDSYGFSDEVAKQLITETKREIIPNLDLGKVTRTIIPWFSNPLQSIPTLPRSTI